MSKERRCVVCGKKMDGDRYRKTCDEICERADYSGISREEQIILDIEFDRKRGKKK